METNQSSQIKNDESAQAGSGNGNQVQDSSQFPELNDFKEVKVSQAELLGQHNYKNPGSEFHTGHWAINDPDPKKIESISQAYPPRDQDLIATIPPAEQDEHITQEVVLPEQVEEVDLHATRLNPVAFTPVDQHVSDTQPVLISQTEVSRLKATNDTSCSGKRGGTAVPPPKPPIKKNKSCFGRVLIIGMIFCVLAILVGGIFAWTKYMEIARTLPSVDELQTRASQFETTYILDRNGNILYEIVDPNAGNAPMCRLSGFPLSDRGDDRH